ncbi:DMT family transporter [Futiania mangrovi]|uniref:DMT family transporter n=1 Tax=Futiania mangrovi TaxID=2959716 RepID=A0A9J6PLC3_9PROT|nr:DMT family transporter [Futiania mangrovii]MCP1337431.1 DMT family transporter [Futiania mangrovii]
MRSAEDRTPPAGGGTAGDGQPPRRGLARIADMPYLLLSLATLFWAGNAVIGRAARFDVPPVTLAFLRWSLAALLVWLVIRPPVARDWPAMKARFGTVLLLAALGVGLFNTMLYRALQTTTALNVTITQSATPVFIGLVTFLVFRERMTLRQAFGFCVSFTGVLVIVSDGDWSRLAALEFRAGDLWMLAAVVIYAAYTALLRLRPAVDPWSFMLVTFVIGAMQLFPVMLWEWSTGLVIAASTGAALTVLYVAVFPSVVSYYCYNRGVEMVGANRAGVFFHLIPLYGSFLAVVFLGERFLPSHGIGLVLVIGGILITTRRKRLR